MSIICVSSTIIYYFFSEHSESVRWMHNSESTRAKHQVSPSVLVNGNSTIRFRENLLLSHKYVTAFTNAGFTNQVMDAIDLVYLATITNRTPIIPPLIPLHFGVLDTVSPLNFGDVFDVPRLAGKMGFPIVEWHEVKSLAYLDTGLATMSELIGCWSTGAGRKPRGDPFGSDQPSLLGLDVAYTPVPSSFTVSRGAVEADYVFSIWALASLGFSETRQRYVENQRPLMLPALSGSGKIIDPDDQLLCFDSLYYTGMTNPDPSTDFFAEYSPFWNVVGTHLHWKSTLVDLANEYLRRHFGIQDHSPIPLFISVHVRHTDFVGGCYTEKDLSKCFAPVKAYGRRVDEIKQRLLAQGTLVTKVLVTSDERDPGWWAEIAAMGSEWGWVDHKAENTTERHGQWFPMLLDAVFQSMGSGVVGTQKSTMSYIARKRVEDWQGGLGVEVLWGNPTADNH